MCDIIREKYDKYNILKLSHFLPIWTHLPNCHASSSKSTLLIATADLFF